MTEIEGVLQIDHSRGVLHFNSAVGVCVLRITNLPPIPAIEDILMMDVSHMNCTSWDTRAEGAAQ